MTVVDRPHAPRDSVDRTLLAALTAREEKAFADANPRSQQLFERGAGTLLGGVPMSWMAKWAGGFPLFLREASGARIVDVDGHAYVDFCLGDTGAMAGHALLRPSQPSPSRPREESRRCSRARTRSWRPRS